MTSYVAFLRAVNVGGRTLKMERLRALLADAGYAGVRTYIQSGNVFFTSDQSPEACETDLERRIEAETKLKVETFVRTEGQLRTLLETSPFQSMSVAEDERHIMLFARGPLSTSATLPIRSEKGDCEVVGHTASEIFVRYWLVDGRPADPTKLIKATFGPVVNTGRFDHTLRKMMGL